MDSFELSIADGTSITLHNNTGDVTAQLSFDDAARELKTVVDLEGEMRAQTEQQVAMGLVNEHYSGGLEEYRQTIRKRAFTEAGIAHAHTALEKAPGSLAVVCIPRAPLRDVYEETLTKARLARNIFVNNDPSDYFEVPDLRDIRNLGAEAIMSAPTARFRDYGHPYDSLFAGGQPAQQEEGLVLAADQLLPPSRPAKLEARHVVDFVRMRSQGFNWISPKADLLRLRAQIDRLSLSGEETDEDTLVQWKYLCTQINVLESRYTAYPLQALDIGAYPLLQFVRGKGFSSAWTVPNEELGKNFYARPVFF